MEVAEYERYGRQMIVPGIGLQGQLKLKNSRVLIVGAGGLGCPAIAYLAGCGVGSLGIVDPDKVETSNLHRQILHTEPGVYKAESAAAYISKLNPNVERKVWTAALSPANALDIVAQYDVVVDCTDSPMSRYLINDACVLCEKPLVSAAALKTEGQLAVYNYGKEGPCYRCLFPSPPPPELVGSCGENGIIGPVVGIMGVYQAIETIKVILGESITPALSMFSMFRFPQWRQVKIRQRQPSCAVCGTSPTITSLHNYDYTTFCGLNNASKDSEDEDGARIRITAAELASVINKKTKTIVDVRPPIQYEMCSIPDTINLPIDQVRRMKSPEDLPFDSKQPIVLICRYGNDSQEAAKKLKTWNIDACDVVGGLHSWSQIDPEFPRY